MLVLHAAKEGRDLLVWAERLDDNGSALQTGQPISANCPAAPFIHPYACGIVALKTFLESFGFDLTKTSATAERAVAWLPALLDPQNETLSVLPSDSVLVAPEATTEPESSGNSQNTVMAPWLITVFKLRPDAWPPFFEAVLNCFFRDWDRLGVSTRGSLGSDTLFWFSLFRRAMVELTEARQMPSLGLEQDSSSEDINSSHEYRSLWHPVFDSSLIRNLEEKAAVMPRACLCIVQDQEPLQPPPFTMRGLPHRECSAFITDAVDWSVRYAWSLGTRTRETKLDPSDIHNHYDRWLVSLRSTTPNLGNSTGSAEVAAMVGTWTGRRPGLGRGSGVLTMILSEPHRRRKASIESVASSLKSPGEDNPDEQRDSFDRWELALCLTYEDDPGTRIPAHQIWGRDRSEEARLLPLLAPAADVFPPLRSAMTHEYPSRLHLTTDQVFNFLREDSLKLQNLGIRLLLPSWFNRHSRAREAGISIRILDTPSLSPDPGSYLNFDWKAALGNEEITQDELQQMAASKVPLVRFRETWVEVDQDSIKAALSMIRDGKSGKASARSLILTAMGGKSVDQVSNPWSNAFNGVEGGGWFQDILRKLLDRSALTEQDPPEGFIGTLRAYQNRGLAWLDYLTGLGIGACLADDMGLGKTIQALALIQRQKECGRKGPVLLVCPTSIVSNWKREAERFTPSMEVIVHHGGQRTRGDDFHAQVESLDMVISSYGLLQRDAHLFREVPWDGIILDEAQNIKNPNTKQSKVARSLKSSWRLALTGTPVENNLMDLWAIMEFINPGLLGSPNRFRKEFAFPASGADGLDRAEKTRNRLQRTIGPLILRRLKTDRTIIDDLPEKMEMTVYCNMTREQAALYSAVTREAMTSLRVGAGRERKGIILATLSRLKQICNHPAHYLGDNSEMVGRSGKLERLDEMVEELLSIGDKALVFTQFVKMGEILRTHLSEKFGFQVPFLHGGLSKGRRQKLIDSFQEPEGPGIFLLSLRAGGTGLNLTAANHVFHYDRWWNPAVEDQATDRAFRIGQVKNVQVHKFVCAGTLEERIDDILRGKTRLAREVVGTGENWLASLSNEELYDIFSLGADDIGE
ncbi:MAG: ATP-dependent helicase [Candidatus Wallbacteria bacterium HGW-Wallbacteria-1]|jgi:SNF2 family DNA or RNA helicase|uniref:ATP-dependent helicase n=1 Tax=Candidatus Wallbacteria bacterium HGW-Wallbacteria-1 TaxID=2013854 RepID=A0A2N1PP22_9BACT|nr:MAG: ATP-dependent helicase [Candidatus Wallbacteria bacterium HGW-Wallbacteria-1]